jgi:hypothetical protein
MRSFLAAPSALFACAVLLAPAASAEPERVGLYPLALPNAPDEVASRLAEQLHDGAAALPGVRAFDLVAHSSCTAEDAGCLAAAARSAGLDAMVSAAVEKTESGYRWHLREVDASGALLHESSGETAGGPLDLAGDLERGVCEAAAGGAPCEGELRVGGSIDAHVFVDGTDRGAPPLHVRLPVGRHTVSLAGAASPAGERRVRISYARNAALFAARRADGPVLLDQPDTVPLPALTATAEPPVAEARSRAARILFGGGVALLGVAAGTALYATYATDASHTAASFATALAITGAAAVAGAGLVLALTPSGAAVEGRF